MIAKSHCLRAEVLGALFISALAPQIMAQASPQLGTFEGRSDIGEVTPPGTLAYDSNKNTYTATAAGANMWSKADDFNFAWKKVSGDVSLTADIHFPTSTGDPNPHRKAVLMFRQDLDADSVYADASQHGLLVL